MRLSTLLAARRPRKYAAFDQRGARLLLFVKSPGLNRQPLPLQGSALPNELHFALHRDARAPQFQTLLRPGMLHAPLTFPPASGTHRDFKTTCGSRALMGQLAVSPLIMPRRPRSLIARTARLPFAPQTSLACMGRYRLRRWVAITYSVALGDPGHFVPPTSAITPGSGLKSMVLGLHRCPSCEGGRL